MNFLILTSSEFKNTELKKYFADAGLKSQWIKSIEEITADVDYFLLQEQTRLENLQGQSCLFDKVEKCIHHSEIKVTLRKNSFVEERNYSASVEGFVFPSLRKTKRKDVYSWDDMFVAKNSHLSNQQLKERGLKNSARDIAFSKMAEDLQSYFTLKNQMNLNFNPIEGEEVISFEPVIYNLLTKNPIYSVVYQNSFFRPLLNKVLNNGLFVRKAKTRAQKNYWLPGVNAGIPLTPKKDDIHELTFMFHDIMHFLFPDFILTGQTDKEKKIYIISRMMSEAFTIIMADFLFVSVLKDKKVDYDFAKRKIYPLFSSLEIEVSPYSLNQIKEVLYKNALFVLLGQEDGLKALTCNDVAFNNYKEKYQPFFTEDYIWTNNNAEHFSQYAEVNKLWHEYVSANNLNSLLTSYDFIHLKNDNLTIFNTIFEVFFDIIEKSIKENKDYDEVLAYKNAFKSYLSGQMMIFYNQSVHYNELFQSSIMNELTYFESSISLSDAKKSGEKILNIYHTYMDTLAEDNLISSYKSQQYKNIYPMFQPFYVFYDKKEQNDFRTILKKVLGE